MTTDRYKVQWYEDDSPHELEAWDVSDAAETFVEKYGSGLGDGPDTVFVTDPHGARFRVTVDTYVHPVFLARTPEAAE